MKTIHDLIKQLEALKHLNPVNEREEFFNNGVDFSCTEVEKFFGMNEPLGERLDARTRKVCVIWLAENKYIENVYPKVVDFFFMEGVALSRYHLEVVLKHKKSVRNLGKKGIEQIEKALS